MRDAEPARLRLQFFDVCLLAEEGVAAVGVLYATVKRWSAGHSPVPEYAASIVELLEGVPTFLRPKRWSR